MPLGSIKGPLVYDYTTNNPLPQLPRMPNEPLDGGRNHTSNLSSRSEPWRRLECIYPLEHSVLYERTWEWIVANVYSNDRSGRMRPEAHNFNSTMNILIYDMDRLSNAIQHFPLQFVQGLLHMVLPRTQEWRFRPNETEEIDQNIFDTFLWSRTKEGADNERCKTSLIIAYQPPWILSSAGFQEFKKCSSLPPHIQAGNAFPTKLNASQRLWAKIWDVCVRHHTRWFVVTSYNTWAFGFFSSGWHSAFISEPCHIKDGQIVLEYLTYWTASSIPGGLGGLEIPKVPEPITAFTTGIIVPNARAGTPLPATSESDWVGKSEDVSTSAHLSSISANVSLCDFVDECSAPTARQKSVPIDLILSWQQIAMDQIDTGTVYGPSPMLYGSEILEGNTVDRGDWLV